MGAIRELSRGGPGESCGRLVVRARALLDGRLAPSVDDVLELAEPVLKHRMALNYKARAEGVSLSDVIKDLAEEI